MESFAREVFAGAVGSVIGAFLVFLGSQGRHLNRAARRRRRSMRRREQEQWASREIGVRQGITNGYLFEILTYLLLGNLLLAVPAITTLLGFAGQSGFIASRIVSTVGGVLALACFFVGLGKTSRYLRLRAVDSERDGDTAGEATGGTGASAALDR